MLNLDTHQLDIPAFIEMNLNDSDDEELNDEAAAHLLEREKDKQTILDLQKALRNCQVIRKLHYFIIF